MKNVYWYNIDVCLLFLDFERSIWNALVKQQCFILINQYLSVKIRIVLKKFEFNHLG